MSQVAALKELLERRFPGAVPRVDRPAPGIATGVAALDRAFPAGGLPRGAVVSWTPGVGTGAVLRSACRTVVGTGERSAWVDGSGVISEGWPSELPLFRTGSGVRTMECAEELVRCGGFALVVVTGVKPRDAERVRLSRAVKEGGGSLVMVDGAGFMAGVRVATRVGAESWSWLLDPFGDPAQIESVRIRARVTAPGWSDEAIFSLPVIDADMRMSVEPMVDRRGAVSEF